jgi:uncharacterized membrane protein
MAEQNKQTATQEAEKQSSGGRLGEAVVAGGGGGAIAGLAAHFLGGGQMTFPIFIIAYIFLLSGLKGWGKLVGLVVFTAVASLVVVIHRL